MGSNSERALIKLAIEENEIAESNYKKYREIIDILDMILLTFWHIPWNIPRQIDPNLFILFWIDARNNITLSMLSLMRNHFNQSGTCTRRTLESLVFSIYFMNIDDYNEIINSFKCENASEILNKFTSKYKKQAFDYFNETFPGKSEEIKKLKEGISKICTHSNFLNVHDTRILDDNNYQFDFYERTTPQKFISSIGLYGKIIDTYMDLIILNNKKMKYEIKVSKNNLIYYKQEIHILTNRLLKKQDEMIARIEKSGEIEE